MSTSFNIAFSKRSSRSQARIRRNLKELSYYSGLGMRIVSNVTAEAWLNEEIECLDRILDIFDEPKIVDLDGLLKRYETECRAASRCGDNISSKLSLDMLGRAVNYETFANHLVLKHGFNKRNQLDSILKSLTRSARVHPLLRGRPISPYSFWSTWNKEDISIDPFGFASHNPYNVCANMGLSHFQDHEPLLIFTFKHSLSMKVKYPTIADAALYEYYRAPTPFDEHGMTLPRDMADFRNNGGTGELKPRPEVVHESINFEDLNLPLRIFRV